MPLPSSHAEAPSTATSMPSQQDHHHLTSASASASDSTIAAAAPTASAPSGDEVTAPLSSNQGECTRHRTLNRDGPGTFCLLSSTFSFITCATRYTYYTVQASSPIAWCSLALSSLVHPPPFFLYLFPCASPQNWPNRDRSGIGGRLSKGLDHLGLPADT